MAYAVILNLSRVSVARVVEVWEHLAREAISSVMLDVGAQPHISLAVFQDLNPEVLRVDLSRFAKATAPLSLDLASAGTFPTAEGVVFLAPAVTQELLEAHRRFHNSLRDRGVDCVDYYLPGKWVPHCTVATGVAPDRMGAALEVCVQSDAFGPVELDEVSLVEFPPVREIYAFPLGGR
ncbi:MAG: 2'-5' RNA ligase family protein [Anaerolineae bacterium]|jgi:2'-5' RNA ligase